MPKISLTAIANILSIGVNALLVILKLVIGFLFNSISLIADGFDSVLDVVSATFAGAGERISRKPPDESHPFGHQKYQLISSLVIAFTMFVSSYFIAEESISRLIVGESYNFEILVLIAAIVSLVTKLGISLVLMKIGKKIKSTIYIANAKNYRTDAISSVFVIIAFIGVSFDVWWLDPVCAFVIVALILFTGYEITKMSLPELLDKGPTPEIIEKLKSIAFSFPEIKDVHIIRLRSIFGQYTGDFHILVDPELTIFSAHEVSEKVKAKLESEGSFRDLLIHIEPFTPEEILEDG